MSDLPKLKFELPFGWPRREEICELEQAAVFSGDIKLAGMLLARLKGVLTLLLRFYLSM